MWSDNETSLDLLGYRHLVGAVLDIVRDDRLLPATIGVFGDWGSGKSSLIQMARAEIERDEDTLVLSFNGWLFEGYDDAKTALMGTIIDELADHKKLTAKGKELVLRLVGRINFWRVAGAASRAAIGYAAAGFPGLAAGAAPDLAHLASDLATKAKDVDPAELGKFLRDEDPGQKVRRGVREFRRDFEELLGETKIKRLVVVVDDLDRCTPDTIIETLEAIKLFLFVPRTAFVIGADERLIRYAVRRRFPELPGERAEVGRDYLEKLVQFPILIPPMGRGETETYIKLLLTERCALGTDVYERIRAAGVAVDSRLDVVLDRSTVKGAIGAEPAKDVDEALALADRIGPVLAAGLNGNPRQCKRFLNTLVMRVQMAKSRGVDLKRRVLAKLMLLEYLRPESFRELAKVQSAQGGTVKELEGVERGPDATADGSPSRAEPPATRSASGGGDAPGTKRPAAAKAAQSEPAPSSLFGGWHADPWLSEWLTAEPRLAGEDLRPYFYFARERLDSLSGLALRMSPQAQEILAKLLGPVEAERTLALGRVAALTQADAAAVFEAIGRRARETETPSAVDSPLARLCDVVERRPELYGEFITFLKGLPHAAVPFALVPRLVQMGSTPPDRKPQMAALFELWSKGTNAALKKAVAPNLVKLTQ